MKILQIGAGGIGSYLAEYMYTLYRNGVQSTEHMDLTLADDDIIEEKNLRYQNFLIEELEMKKASALSERYFFNVIDKRIESKEDLKGFDVIILAVDNGKCRKLVYEYCEKEKIPFIDLRSEGTAVCFYTSNKENTLKKMMGTIDAEAAPTSCQLKFELDQGKIQQGNKIIAAIGSQLILNHLRGEPNKASFVQRF